MTKIGRCKEVVLGRQVRGEPRREQEEEEEEMFRVMPCYVAIVTSFVSGLSRNCD